MFEMDADDDIIIRPETTVFFFSSLFVLLYFEFTVLATLYAFYGTMMFFFDDEEDEVEFQFPEVTTYREDWLINYPYLSDLASEDDIFTLLEEAPENMDANYSSKTPESWKFEQDYQQFDARVFNLSTKELDRFNFFFTNELIWR